MYIINFKYKNPRKNGSYIYGGKRKIITGILGGLIPAILSSLLIIIVSASSPEKAASRGLLWFILAWICFLVLSITAKTTAKAWRKLFLSSAILSFLLPISGLIYTGVRIFNSANLDSEYTGAQILGSAIGGGMISGLMGFFGFFLGVIFLIVGLLTGRDKQVVYVEKEKDNEEK